jgi:uncharacterized protein HemX
MVNQPPENEKNNSNVAGVLFVAALLALAIWLAHVLYKNLQLQKCEMEGRRDCVDIPQPANG